MNNVKPQALFLALKICYVSAQEHMFTVLDPSNQTRQFERVKRIVEVTKLIFKHFHSIDWNLQNCFIREKIGEMEENECFKKHRKIVHRQTIFKH
jgi:hypothetical protein